MTDHESGPHVVEVLLIEDNPGDVRLTREALNQGENSCRLNVVQDGEQAMDYLYCRDRFTTALRPDLILLDLNLPRRSGLDVLAEVKGDSSLGTIPVIIFTSSKSEREISSSYELRANCFITKPVSLDRFMEVVRSIEQFWMGIVHLPAR